jgi:ABC-2 type transport system permease protein
MSKLIPLIRVGLKSNFGLAILHHRLFREKKDRWLVPIFIISLLGILPALYNFCRLIGVAYDVLKPIGQDQALLAISMMAGQLVIIIFGIYYLLAAFYFSRDMETLIPLPVRAAQVILSKFFVVMVNEYLTVAVFVLPFVITYGVRAKGNVGYWVNATLIYLTLPIIPLAIVSVLVVAMMRVINLSRKKDFLIFAGSIVLIAFSMSIQFMIQRASNGGTNMQMMASFLSSPNNLINRIGASFPPSIWATKAIAGGFSLDGLMHLSLFLGTSLLCFGVMMVLAERMFYRGVIGLSETTIRKQALTRDQMSQRVSSGRGAIAAIFIREWRIMNRTPIFLLNGVLVVVILPIIFFGIMKSGSDELGRTLLGMTLLGNSISTVLILSLVMTICGCFNSTSSSTFSREGVQFWISRVIPVAPRDQAVAKFLHSFLIGLLGIVAALIVFSLFLPLKLGVVTAALLLALVTSAFLINIGMMIDLARPLLDWTNPQKAVKQNLNVMLAMFADLGFLTAAFWAVKALFKARLSGMSIFSVLFTSMILLAAASHFALLKFADKRYPEIEN